MKTKIYKVVVSYSIMLILLLTNCCVVGGKLRTESETVELDGAESVSVEINMGAGKLNISGGADELLNANFLYRVRAWKPKINYNVSDNKGVLIIEQPGVVRIPVQGYRYEWDLRFNDDVPMDLSVILGAGENNLKLGSLNLTSLDIEIGVGELKVDLTGEWKNDLDANIEGGVGRMTLMLPSNVGVRVDVDRGLGTINAVGLKKDGDFYVNDAYEISLVTLNIELDVGIGEINLEINR